MHTPSLVIAPTLTELRLEGLHHWEIPDFLSILRVLPNLQIVEMEFLLPAAMPPHLVDSI